MLYEAVWVLRYLELPVPDRVLFADVPLQIHYFAQGLAAGVHQREDPALERAVPHRHVLTRRLELVLLQLDMVGR